MKTITAILIVTVLLMFVAAGSALAKTQVTLWCMAFDPHIRAYTAVAEAFMAENPDIDIVIDPQPGQAEMGAKMRASLAAGVGADLFTATGTQILEWAVPGSIQPLTPDVFPSVDWVKENLLPEYYLQCNLDNHIWAVGTPDPPGDAGIVVNVDHLAEAGLAYNNAFVDIDQLIDYAQKLAVYDNQGNVLRGGLNFQESNNPNFFLSYLVEIGGEFWDNDEQLFNFQTVEAEEVMTFFAALFDEYKVDSTFLPTALDALVQELSSMAFMWPEFLPFAEIAYPDMNFGYMVKPPFHEGNRPLISHTDTWNLVMPSYVSGDQKEAVVRFLEFQASVEGQMIYAEENPGLPMQRSLIDDEFFKTGKGAYLEPVIEIMRDGYYRYWGPFPEADVLLYNLWWPNMDSLFHGMTSIPETLEKMEREANQQVMEMRDKYPNVPEITVYYDALPPDLAIQ